MNDREIDDAERLKAIIADDDDEGVAKLKAELEALKAKIKRGIEETRTIPEAPGQEDMGVTPAGPGHQPTASAASSTASSRSGVPNAMRRMAMEEALRRAILAGDNLLAELESHQENTGEFLESEDQGVVEGAKQDLDFARNALATAAQADD